MHVLLGAKTVFTAFSSPYRRTVMQLGATVMVGGFAPALLLMIGRPDLDPTLLQEPSVRGILSNTRDVTRPTSWPSA